MKTDGSLARNIDFEVANLEVHKKTRRETSILKLPWVSKSSDFSFFDVLLYLDFLLVKFTFAW